VVEATVVKVQNQPTRMRFATVWKYSEQQWLQNMTKEVLCVVMTKEVLCAVFVLPSHQIDDVESIDSPNNGQHEFLSPDLSLHLLRDILSRYVPFRRMLKFQSEPTFVRSHKSVKFIFLVSHENGQQFSASFHPNLSETHS
jgi:hypothetical protein